LTKKRPPDLNGITKFFYMLSRLVLKVTCLQHHLIYIPTQSHIYCQSNKIYSSACVGMDT